MVLADREHKHSGFDKKVAFRYTVPIFPIFMSQEAMIKLECSECKHANYFSRKNKKKLRARLEMKKFCKFCSAHLLHKETK